MPDVVVGPHPEGHFVVLQMEHAAMAAKMVSAWGNARFGDLGEAREPIRRAELLHELGWVVRDAAPLLNPETGLPHTYRTLDLSEHLRIQLDSVEQATARDPHAGLLVSLHFTSRYARPSLLKHRRGAGREIRGFLAANDRLRARIRPRLEVSDARLARDGRLTRAIDALSIGILGGSVPRLLRAVPAAAGELDVYVARDGAAHTFDPWPFAAPRVDIDVAGRVLTRTYTDVAALREDLAAAPERIETYTFIPAAAVDG
jgi:hypothetical protein